MGNHSNFMPILYAEKLERERDVIMVAANICNRDYEGEVKNKGDKVKILGVSRPTIVEYNDKTGLGDFERINDQSTMLEITQAKAFHFYIGKIEDTQAAVDFENAERQEAAAGLAQAMDSFIYEEALRTKASVQKVVNSVSSANILNVIATHLAMLWKNGVPRTETVYMECSPNVISKLMLAKMIVDTDNTKVLTSGAVGKLRTFNVEVEMSNNIPAYESSGEYIIFRTRKAISLAEQITEVEEYKPEKYFGKAIKGLQVYGAKVIRPKELIITPIASFTDEIAE